MQYDVGYKEVCNGIALTGIFSFLKGDFLKFQELYHYLNYCRENKPEELVAQLKSIAQKIIHNSKTDITPSLLLPYTVEEKELKFVRAFLESIVLYRSSFVNIRDGPSVRRFINMKDI